MKDVPERGAGVGVGLEIIFLLVLQWNFVYIFYKILLLYCSFLYFFLFPNEVRILKSTETL